MGFLSFLNPITAPLGFKLGSGGPYSDRGLSDQSMAASKPMQQAGQNFLNLSQGIPDPNGTYAGLYAQQARESGVSSPFGGGVSTYHGVNGRPSEPGVPTPGELTGSYADQFNNYKGHLEEARKNALGQLRSHMSARGLGDSSEARSHEAYLHSQFDKDLADNMAKLQGTQHQERMSTLDNFIKQLQGFASTGGALVSGNVQNLNQNAAAAENRTNNANSQLGGLASMFTPGGAFGNVFGGSNNSPSMTGNAYAPGQHMYGPFQDLGTGYNTIPFTGDPWRNPFESPFSMS